LQHAEKQLDLEGLMIRRAVRTMYSYSTVIRKTAQRLLNLSLHENRRKVGSFEDGWPSHRDRVNHCKSSAISSLNIPIEEQVPPYSHGLPYFMGKETRKNKQGDEFINVRRPVPPGYKFVPLGGHFMTRRCRELAQKRYAVMRGELQDGHWYPRQIGLYVPDGIYKEVDAEYKARVAKRVEAFWAGIHKDYPGMPPDEERLFRESQLNDIYRGVKRITPETRHVKVRHYVCQRYVQVEHVQQHRFKNRIRLVKKATHGGTGQRDSTKSDEKGLLKKLWSFGAMVG
jgi:hypothetical protein